MNTQRQINYKSVKIGAAMLTATLLAACGPSNVRPDGADAVRMKLTELQSDATLAPLVPSAIMEAEAAVRAAEQPTRDREYGRHLVTIADRKVDTAWAQAQELRAEDQREALNAERDAAQLAARTREADLARHEAAVARAEASSARSEIEEARIDAEIARSDADVANLNSAQSAREAEAARVAAAVAQSEVEAERQRAIELQLQLTELNARETERGLVVTLGDVLFATGRAELIGSVPAHLANLAAFLDKYADRTIVIEGHTDNVGDADMNLDLSLRRANSVQAFLIGRGVDPARIVASGKGEDDPVASNNSETGRQQNRRVEVIISNSATAAR